MDNFIERMPLRIAALAGLIVGGISLYTDVSLTTCIERVAISLIVFGIAGAILRFAMRLNSQPVEAMHSRHVGTRFDSHMPDDMTDDLTAMERGLMGDQGDINIQ